MLVGAGLRQLAQAHAASNSRLKVANTFNTVFTDDPVPQCVVTIQHKDLKWLAVVSIDLSRRFCS